MRMRDSLEIKYRDIHFPRDRMDEKIFRLLDSSGTPPFTNLWLSGLPLIDVSWLEVMLTLEDGTEPVEFDDERPWDEEEEEEEEETDESMATRGAGADRRFSCKMLEPGTLRSRSDLALVEVDRKVLRSSRKMPIISKMAGTSITLLLLRRSWMFSRVVSMTFWNPI